MFGRVCDSLVILRLTGIETENKLPMGSLLRRRANARNVSYTPNHSGQKQTISTLVDKTHIQRTLQRRKDSFCFKTNLPVRMELMPRDLGRQRFGALADDTCVG